MATNIDLLNGQILIGNTSNKAEGRTMYGDLVINNYGQTTLTNALINDDNFRLKNDLDNTKRARFDLALLTTSTTRIYSLPDKNGTILVDTDLSSYQPLDADLTAIAALATTGFAVRTAASTWALRAITGTANQITVTNGSGVAGNPVLGIADNATLPGNYVTLPGGPTSTRPAAGNAGRLRYNTTINEYEWDNGTEWREIGISSKLNSGQILLGNSSNRAAKATMYGDVVINNQARTTVQSASIYDDNFFLRAELDTTKRGRFDMSLLTTGTTRIYKLPDKNGTVALLSDITGGSVLNPGEIFVGNALSEPTSVAMSGDTTITQAGVVTIANDAVTTAKIDDDAVSLAKMAAGTAGNLISYDAAGDPVAVATGTAGQVLTSNGAGLPPTFQAGGGVSALTDSQFFVGDAGNVAQDVPMSGDMALANTGAVTAQPALISGKPAATVASGDLVMIGDISSANALSQTTVQDIANLAPPGSSVRELFIEAGATVIAGKVYNTYADALVYINASGGSGYYNRWVCTIVGQVTENVSLQQFVYISGKGNSGVLIGTITASANTGSQRHIVEELQCDSVFPGGVNTTIECRNCNIVSQDNSAAAGTIWLRQGSYMYKDSGNPDIDFTTLTLEVTEGAQVFDMGNFATISVRTGGYVTFAGNASGTYLNLYDGAATVIQPDNTTITLTGGLYAYNSTIQSSGLGFGTNATISVNNGATNDIIGMTSYGTNLVFNGAGTNAHINGHLRGQAKTETITAATGATLTYEGEYMGPQTGNVITGDDVISNLLELDGKFAVADGNVFVGNASGVATSVAMSGDATIVNTGALTIANNAITTAKIADDQVTVAKVADGTAGELITWDATGEAAVVATGTSGHILTSNGAGAAPTFQANSALSTTLADTNIFVGNGTNVATGVAVSGDMNIANTGAMTAQPAIITGKAAATVASGDLVLVADIDAANALKQVTAQSIADLFADATTFDDSTFRIFDNVDNTKLIAFEASGITTGTTRTFTAPDASGTLALTSDLGTIASQDANNVAITGGAISGTTVTVADNVFTIQDNVDATKQAVFEASGITTATTRTYTLPDASGTIALTASTLSNTLTDTNIFVGNGSNVATGVAMSGDATIANTGALTIANDAVTLAKMAAGTAGNLITYDAAGDPAAVAVGTSGQVLQTAGAGAVPAWADQIYDIPFNAGFGSTGVKEDVAVQTYGEMVVARSGSFTGEAGYADTAPTGAALILDIEKNGVTIYTTKPQFAATSQTLTAGTLKADGTEDFVSGDRITFKITQIGSTEPGEGIRFTAKAGAR